MYRRYYFLHNSFIAMMPLAALMWHCRCSTAWQGCQGGCCHCDARCQYVIRPAKAFGDQLKKCLSNLKLHGKLHSLHSFQEMDYAMLLGNVCTNQNYLFYMSVLLWTSVRLLRSPTLSHLTMFCLGFFTG